MLKHVVSNYERGPIMLFYKVLFYFGGVLEHNLMLGENVIIFHIIYIITIPFSPAGHKRFN